MSDRPFTTPETPGTTVGAGAGETLAPGSDAGAFPQAPVAAPEYPTGDSGRYPTTGSTSATETAKQTAATAKDEARSVASDAKEGTRQVAETAKSETREVAAQAQHQARQLFDQLRGEASGQAADQTRRAAGGLRALADELGQMGSGTQQQGIASDLARQASSRVRSFADWLEKREPGDILNEARAFARRRPGAFLAAAATVGFVGGRMTRGLVDEDGSRQGSSAPTGTTTPLVGATPTYTPQTTADGFDYPYGDGPGPGLAGEETGGYGTGGYGSGSYGTGGQGTGAYGQERL